MIFLFFFRRRVGGGRHIQRYDFGVSCGQPAKSDRASGLVCVRRPRRQTQCQPHGDPHPRKAALPAQQQAREMMTQTLLKGRRVKTNSAD